MSTKNLSRTVIEGGRAGSNKWERRHSSREERAKTREFLSRIKKDPESFEEDPQPQRKKVYKEFDDKLGPVYRWVRSQVGRPWNDVKSEVFQTFDTRNLAGSHIVYDHLLSSVEEVKDYRYSYRTYPEDETTSYFKNDFYVDDEGILRERKKISRRGPRKQAVHTKVITDWIGGRIVGKVGNKMFWFVPVNPTSWAEEWKCEWKAYFDRDDVARGGELEYYKLYYTPVYDKLGAIIDHKPEWKAPIFFETKRITSRQSQEFSRKDMDLWNQIPTWCQQTILQWAPNSTNPPKVNRYSYYW